MQPGVVQGAVLELHAMRAKNGESPGNNDDPTEQWYDTSGHGNHGTQTAGTGFAFTPSSGWATSPNCLVFDGTNDYMYVVTKESLNTAPFTWEFWLCPTSFTTAWLRGILMQEVYLTSGLRIGWADAGEPCMWFNQSGGSPANFCSGPVMTLNQWNHVVLTLSAPSSGTATVWTNGVAGTPLTGCTYVVGSNNMNFMHTVSEYGAGKLAVIRRYPFVLSADQIAQNYALGYFWRTAFPKRAPFEGVDDSLWRVIVGSDERGWRDVTDEAVGLSYTTVMPGGSGSCSFSLPAGPMGTAYNEVDPDQKIQVFYAGTRVWNGFVLPRGFSYGGG